ncbi:MAG: rod-binding protein [Kordiimonadaceae bacterium]|nr:rod-binding protein [Kordiimonadaceae bacterium]MBO6570673.1 rod-binding protein [Kordiimonadaceae bacterium]MBO6966469.1 rod-binding protein [Kordiimonadaceae bacterium]
MQTVTINAAQDQMIEAQLRASQAGLNKDQLAGMDKRAARQTAEQFEAVFLSQMLAPMFETVKTDSFMGGGHAEQVYRGMMVEEMGKEIAKQGGIGIADSVYREILKLQEA